MTTITRPASAAAPIPRTYVLYLRDRLLEAEAHLTAMTGRYERTKARFDRCYARRGITPDTDIVNYINAKTTNPELKFWYSKVEHFQREVAAYGAALTGLDAANRMLGTDDQRASAENQRSRAGRRGFSRAS
ncbi:hypothetical protein [Micromonospora sp. NPDC126480]|uniref:hypothetical protein n=1 Tax=Micromonospora sp. NPDC126480 TaxID=3155312 RepID=UPI0033171108